jgi:hypothetical protein
MAHGIQSQIGVVPAPAVEGDFASSNPRWNVLSGPGAFVAGPSGVTIGRFAWASSLYQDADNAPAVINSFGSGPVLGFVARNQQGLISNYLQSSGMTIPAGFMVVVHNGGEFWVRNAGSNYVSPPLLGVTQKAYANLADGSVTFGLTATPTTGSLTTSSIAAATAITGTASISGNVLNVVTLTAGSIQIGAILTGPPGVATGTQIVGQLSGTPNGVGTYALNIGEQTVPVGALAGTYGVLTVGGGTAPVPGAILSGSGVTTGTQVFGQLTSTTFVVSPSQTASSTTITDALNVETKFYAMSGGGAGELIKITSHLLG